MRISTIPLLIVFFLLSLAIPAFSQVTATRDIVLCPGESYNLFGVIYSTSDTTVVVLPGNPPAPDTVVTYRFHLKESGGGTEACDCHPTTFFKTLGRETQTEFGTALAASRDGNIFLAGRKGNKTFIQKMNPFGEVIWIREFALNAFEPVTPTEIFEDSQGMLVGCGTQGTVPGFKKGYVFRYNPETNVFLWERTVTGTNPEAAGIMEKSGGLSYLYYYNTAQAGGQADPEILEMLKANGNTIAPINRRYEIKNADLIQKWVEVNGDLYSVGTASGRSGVSNASRRLWMAHYDPFAIPDWSQLSHRDTADTGDFFARDMVADGNALVAVYDGDENSSQATASTAIFIQKTSLSGQMLWLKRYNLAATAFQILSVNDGYVVYGQTASNERFVLKTDKSGNYLWAKKIAFGPAGTLTPSVGHDQAMAIGSDLFFTGLTTTNQGDIFLLRLDQNGGLADTCGFVTPLNVPVEDVVAVLTAQPTATYLSFFSTSDNSPSMTATSLFEQLQCPGCVEPDPCPAGNDFVVNLLSTTCSGGGISMHLSVCDLDGGSLPSKIQVAFYNANPTLSAATNLFNYEFSTGGVDSCVTFTIPNIIEDFGAVAAAEGQTVYAVVNFDGVLAAPFTFGDFPVTSLEECVYTNNIDSLVIDVPSQPTLDLGPTQVVCAGETAVLTPGPVFFNYKWSTGSVQDTIFTTQAGTFSVTVTDFCGAKQSGSVSVQVKSLPTLARFATICPGESVTIYGNTYTQGGIFVDTIPALGPSCDTIVTFFITKLPYQTRSENILFCESITINGMVYDESGLVRDTVDGITGCDTIVFYFLSQLPRPFRNDTAYICPGGSITVGGQVYTQPGFVVDTIPSSSNIACDTLLKLWIFQLPQEEQFKTVEFCQGSSVTIGGNMYTQPGTVDISVPSGTGGCDTLVHYTLVMLPAPTREVTVSFCQGASVTIGGQTYTQPGEVTLIVPGSGGGCDTVVTYTLSYLPTPTRAETISFCQGASVTLGGNVYTQPGTVTLTAPGSGSACDTLVTYTLQYVTPAPSTLSLTCPTNISVATVPGTGAIPVAYGLPVAATNCTCDGTDLQLESGLLSGASFPVGTTQVCYSVTDQCNSSASCCFKVTVREELPCDVKTSGCIKYELLSVTTDPSGQYTYKIRVTNNCTGKLIYTAIALPDGVTAVSPADNAMYTAPEGNQFVVRNPNYTPIYSIRFKSVLDSIAGGAYATLEFTLPEQIHPTYFNIVSRIAPQTFYEAYLNTFNCPIGVTPSQNREQASVLLQQPGLKIYPNPTSGTLYADLSAWEGQPVAVRIWSSVGALVHSDRVLAGADSQAVALPAGIVSGMYYLEVVSDNGDREVVRFVVER